MTKYLIDNEQVTKEEFEETLEEAVSDYVHNNMDDLLDECHEEIHIGNLTFSASEVLKKCDPIAYNCSINDFVDSFLTDAYYEAENGGYNSDGTIFEITEEETES